jgi:hypothetical protein
MAAYAGIAMCTLVMLGGGGAAVATRQKIAGGGAAFVGMVSVIMLSLYVAGYLGGAPKRDRAIKEATKEGGEFKKWMVPIYDAIKTGDAYDYEPKGDEREKANQFMEMGKLYQTAQCKYSDWSDWDNDCSDPDNSFRARTRTIGDGADAKKCKNTRELEACGAQDCTMSEWSKCDADGKQTRTVVSPALFGGKACGALESTENCSIVTVPKPDQEPEEPVDDKTSDETGEVIEYLSRGGVDYQSGVIKMHKDKTVEECQAICDADESCGLIVRNPDSGTCWTKRAEDIKSIAPMANRNAYIKKGSERSIPDDVRYASKSGTNYWGRIVEGPNKMVDADISECLRACDDNLNCDVVVYSAADGKGPGAKPACWLKSADDVTKRNPDEKYTSYIKSGLSTDEMDGLINM